MRLPRAHQSHRLFGCALLQTESLHCADSVLARCSRASACCTACPTIWALCCVIWSSCCTACADFLAGPVLCSAGARSPTCWRPRCGCPRHLRNAIPGRADQASAGFDLPHRRADQRRISRAASPERLRQGAHLGSHHGKSTPLLTRAGRLDCGVERQDVGLKGNAIDHADDFGHAPRTLLNGLHRLHGTGHGLGPLHRLPPAPGRLLVGTQGRLRIALHSGRKAAPRWQPSLPGWLPAAQYGLPARGCHGQALAGVGHQRCVAANVGHHGGELVSTIWSSDLAIPRPVPSTPCRNAGAQIALVVFCMACAKPRQVVPTGWHTTTASKHIQYRQTACRRKVHEPPWRRLQRRQGTTPPNSDHGPCASQPACLAGESGASARCPRIAAKRIGHARVL
jgi:hypothetical protein